MSDDLKQPNPNKFIESVMAGDTRAICTRGLCASPVEEHTCPYKEEINDGVRMTSKESQ